MKIPKFTAENTTSGTATITSKTKGARLATVCATQPCGPRRVGDSVIFVAFYPQANAVNLAGDFNNWQPAKNPMTKAGDGTWQTRVPLAKGTYRYRLVVDGRWRNDPRNDMTEPNPYGELNSVLKVE